jgi:hypothetical protein
MFNRHEEQKRVDKNINVVVEHKDLSRLDGLNVLRDPSSKISDKYISSHGHDNPFIANKNHSILSSQSYDNIIENQYDDIDSVRKAKDLFGTSEVKTYDSNVSESYTPKVNHLIQKQKASRTVKHDKDISDQHLNLDTQQFLEPTSNFMKKDDLTFNTLQPLNIKNLEILAKNKSLFITIKTIEKDTETYSSVGVEEDSEYRFTLVFIPGKDQMSAGHYMLEEDGRIVGIAQADDNTCAYSAIKNATGMTFNEIIQGAGLDVEEIPKDAFNKKDFPYEIEINDIELGIGGSPNFLFKNIARKSSQVLKMLDKELFNKELFNMDFKCIRVNGITVDDVKQREQEQIYKIEESQVEGIYARVEVDTPLNERIKLFQQQPFYKLFIELSKLLSNYRKENPNSGEDVDINAFSTLIKGAKNTFNNKEKYASTYQCKPNNSGSYEKFEEFMNNKTEGSLVFFQHPEVYAIASNQLRGLDKVIKHAQEKGLNIEYIKQEADLINFITAQDETIIKISESNENPTYEFDFKELIGDSIEQQF